MTQRHESINQQVLDELRRNAEKIDTVMVNLSELMGDFKALQKQVNMQPEVDSRRFEIIAGNELSCQKNNNTRFQANESRIDSLEEDKKWKDKSIWGLVFGLLAKILYDLMT